MNFYHQMSRRLVIYSADASNHRGWRAILGPVGFDPQRHHVRRPSDLMFVAAGLIVAILAVAWALFG